MSSPLQPHPPQTTIGRPPNFWLFSPTTGYDLTHPSTPTSPLLYPRLPLQTSTVPITISPAKTALIIIDMQNFFLSPALGRPEGEGHAAAKTLVEVGIPAARKAGIQIIWLNWGLSRDDLEGLPPNLWRAFGVRVVDGLSAESGVGGGYGEVQGVCSREERTERGIGLPLGDVILEDGTTIDAGNMLMQNQWNTALYPPLQTAYSQSLNTPLPDMRFHKSRISGLWGYTDCQAFLEEKGIKTLLFGGVNTDQCVLGTLQDAASKGWDTVLLRDGCGTASPGFARECVEFNCRKSWGFSSSCGDLWRGVEGMERSSGENH